MKIATVSKKGKDTGVHILVLSKKECKDLLDILSDYCYKNKKKKLANKYLEKLEENILCY